MLVNILINLYKLLIKNVSNILILYYKSAIKIRI